ncbi:MAG: hypothetical protein AAFP04_00575 [Myxococcota bacterium]
MPRGSRLFAVWGLSSIALACGGGSQNTPAQSGPSSTNTSSSDEPSESTLESWFEQHDVTSPEILAGRGVDPDPESAKRIAQKALEDDFWGEIAWPVLPAGLAEFATERPSFFVDVEIEQAQFDDNHAVVASARLDGVGEIAERWLGEIDSSLPAPASADNGFRTRFAAAAHSAWFAEASTLVCECLARHGIDIECGSGESSPARAELRALADGLVIEAQVQGGVPLDPAGRPLRPLEVAVNWTDGRQDAQPARDVPLMITDGIEMVQNANATSDVDGIARFPFVTSNLEQGRGIGVEVDRVGMLGDLSDTISEIALSIRLRRITPGTAKIAIQVIERGSDPGSEHLAETLELGLRERRDSDVVRISSEEDVATTPSAIKAFTQSNRGRFDILVLGEASSQLTSRMGSRSVYHEATAELTLFDAWSGEPITTVKGTAQGLGLGESRAARNALKKLGELMVDDIVLALKRPVAQR